MRGYLLALARRLERVRICCGDWRRVCKSDTTVYAGRASAAVFLDPPYSTSPDLYAQCADVTADVREWCAAHGDDPSLRIALCGYLDDHDALLERGWRKVVGRAGGSGMTKDRQGGKRERIWLSPHCAAVPDLFDMAQ